MNLRRKYLILDEESNAADYLSKSVEFLEKIDKDLKYLKWFTISFHGAVYSFVLLVLQQSNSEQIFTDKKTSSHSLYRELISFKKSYAMLKSKTSVKIEPYIPFANQDACINELNDKLRNQMIHFRPTVWASGPWYFAAVCYPLLDVLRFCVGNYQFKQVEKEKLLTYIEKVGKMLRNHIN